MAAYYTLVALGLCLLMGYAGQVSMGHAGFFAIGGYTAAVISTAGHRIAGSRCPRAWRPQPLVALLVGIPVLRLRGHYLAMATLAFGFIVSRVILGTRSSARRTASPTSPPTICAAGLAISGRRALRVQNYYSRGRLCLSGWWLRSTRTLAHGQGAPRHPRQRGGGSGMGIDVARYKLAVFVLSAVYAGLGRRLPRAFQRRDRPRRGGDHEVGALRRPGRGGGHGKPLGHPRGLRRHDFPLPPRRLRPVRRCGFRRDPCSNHALCARTGYSHGCSGDE